MSSILKIGSYLSKLDCLLGSEEFKQSWIPGTRVLVSGLELWATGLLEAAELNDFSDSVVPAFKEA